MDERLAKFTELMKDVDFMGKVLKMTPEEAVAAFKAEGAEFTVDEMTTLAELIKKQAEMGDELDEEALAEVAGGAKWDWRGYVCAAGSVAIAGVSAFGIGMLMACPW